jgi:hypothetical protein
MMGVVAVLAAWQQHGSSGGSSGSGGSGGGGGMDGGNTRSLAVTT